MRPPGVVWSGTTVPPASVNSRGRGYTFQERWCAVDDTTAPASSEDPRSSVSPLIRVRAVDVRGAKHEFTLSHFEAHRIADEIASILGFYLEEQQ